MPAPHRRSGPIVLQSASRAAYRRCRGPWIGPYDTTDLVNRIALVTHTTSYGVAGFVDAARRAGSMVVLASDRCHVLDRSWQWPSDSLVIDFSDLDAAAAVIAAANDAAAPISAVLPVGGELPAKVAAAAARRLGLAANAPDAMACAANKL